MQTYSQAIANAKSQAHGDESALPRVFTRPSEHLHPAQIDYAKFGDNPILKTASEALAFAQERLAAIDELRANPHPEDKPATHARKVREAVSKFEGVWEDKWDGGKAALQAELKRVNAALDTKAELKPIDRHFDAITATFYGMSPEERSKAITMLIAEGDHSTLATLIDAPLLVTKLTAEQRDGIKLRVLLNVDPEGVALRDQLKFAMDKWENASFAGIRIVNRLLEGTDRFTQRANEAEAVAARSKF